MSMGNTPDDVARSLSKAPALSVRQPWAELILQRRKRVELRSWFTYRRGWIWLHTGIKTDGDGLARLGQMELFTGGFVGAFFLRDVVVLDEERWEQWRASHLSRGPCPPDCFGWVIGATARLQAPVPARGSMGLFEIDPSLIDQLLGVPLDTNQ